MIRDKILEFLKKKSEYASGEEISERLGISRQALWKHIQELRDTGYDIVAVPHLGYQLLSSPDRLLAGEISHGLNTKFIGRKICYLETAPSTMGIAAQMGMSGCPEGAVVVAEAQTRGKGRLGRAWISPKYQGIYLSLVLRPKLMPAQSPILTLMAAVSICEAIKETCGLDAKIKWPNDILIHNKKVGGILTELSAETDEIRFIVIGIGLNVNNDRKMLVEGATSLKEQMREEVNRIVLLQEILRRIESNYLILQKKTAKAIIDKWRLFNLTLGRRIKVISHGEHLEGEAVGIDTDGGLLLRRDSGLTQKVMAGDVVHCR